MKKIIALLLAALILLLSGCTTQSPETKQSESTNIVTEPNGYVDIPDKTADDYVFTGLSDPSLLQFLQDDVYAGLASNLASDDYIIQSVSTVYLSKEYIEEKAYNTLENNYFGYKLSDLDAFFEGTRYVFTLGENGETVVKSSN